ncbi:glycosyltransferase family 1 protein [Planktothrix sp. FACHB-1355]|uniref:Glycosyltransferase family 1 protein n=1 Tax=Aerosakkonema funiforme FACHB-1375 TaxID=2949571 RepID=A0A926VHW1_9CYAN|nr:MULTISPECIES: glycosyltransferase [Oscillatoriales]MBD2183438.1 glycosyltransferase family 1 protein [Aerosakkonema funiforme FACHB-1375]MBD3557617.1 glycosyltransferase family 1 protein [Planktothrix sp. FACHB-1355]
MHILIIALGSRGDVQPYVALGKGLKEAGHVVRLITYKNFEMLVSSCGLEFWPVKGNVQEIIESKEMRELLEKGNFLAITSRTAKEAQRTTINLAEEGLAACQGIDLLIAGIGGLYLAISLAEKLALPLIQAYVVPFTATKAFPGVLFPQSLSKLGGAVNRLSHHLIRQILWQGFRTADNLARQQVLDLPTAPFWGPYNSPSLHNSPILYGLSSSVIPKPSDWDGNTHVTGYWFLDSASDWTPSSALMEFLQNGSPPVYIGFGSMSNRKPEETADLVLQALARTQQRAILLSGWDGLRAENLPDTVFIVDSVPHSWLFPRVAAIVHHGGAGTTAASLRAGVPSIVIPFFGDQTFWGQRVAELGVGPAPIPRKLLTVERLAQAIQQAVSDRTMRQRAANLGAKIQAEDGIANAVAVVKEIEKRGLVNR